MNHPDNKKTPNELVDQFTVDHRRDIQPYFKLEEHQVRTYDFDNCPNCRTSADNMTTFLASSWSQIRRCRVCHRIIVAEIKDPMTGVLYDDIFIYTEK